MKKQEVRWYLLFFCAAVVFALTACLNSMGARSFSSLSGLQLLAAVLSLAAGLVDRRRWRKKREEETD